MSESPRIRAMTEADYVELYGSKPDFTIRGWTAELNGRAAGVGGIYYTHNATVLFAKVSDALKPHRRFIRRAANILAKMGREHSAIAIADPRLPRARKLLSHIGMESIGPTRHGEVFAWKTSKTSHAPGRS